MKFCLLTCRILFGGTDGSLLRLPLARAFLSKGLVIVALGVGEREEEWCGRPSALMTLLGLVCRGELRLPVLPSLESGLTLFLQAMIVI